MKEIHKKYSNYKSKRKKILFKDITVNMNTLNKNKSKSFSIIIPYRDREKNLKDFILYFEKYLIPNFNLKNIIIVEQNNKQPFNRGILLNIGSKYAFEIIQNDYVIQHDVDLIPDEEMKPYYLYFPNNPVHLGWRWKEVYNFNSYLGGVISFSKNDFTKINGYSNSFFGWGGEDDSLYNRLADCNIPVYRPTTGSYKSLEHDTKHRKSGPEKKEKILKNIDNWKKNGLSDLKYKLDSIEEKGKIIFIKVSF